MDDESGPLQQLIELSAVEDRPDPVADRRLFHQRLNAQRSEPLGNRLATVCRGRKRGCDPQLAVE